MPIYMSPVESTMPSDGGYNAYSTIQVGSNGSVYGAPTEILGDVWGDEDYAYQTWDNTLSGGFDSGNVDISYGIAPDGTETLEVGEQDVASYQTDSLGTISSVMIEAGVETNAEVKWSNLKVQFLSDGNIVETDNCSTIDLNTISSGSNNTAFQTETITPTVKNADQVVVSGTIRMRSPGIDYPASNAMFFAVLAS